MDESSITQFIQEAFADVDQVEAMGARFFFFNPPGELPPDHRFPFATLVTTDEHDTASHLSRPGVFRLNVGVGKATYHSLFGPPPPFPTDGGVVDTGHDFRTLDRIMPHPVYAAMFWVCVLNPSEATLDTLRPLLTEAYELAISRHAKRAS
jgi:hypothetical protein